MCVENMPSSLCRDFSVPRENEYEPAAQRAHALPPAADQHRRLGEYGIQENQIIENDVHLFRSFLWMFKARFLNRPDPLQYVPR